MNILKAIMIAVLLCLAPNYAFSSNLGYMRISLIEGDVQLQTPEAEDWGYATVNTPLAEGDQVWVTEGSRAEFQLNTGTYIRLDENTALQILSIDKDSSQFYLSQGYAYIFYDGPRGGVIQIDTPDTSTRAFNRAIFRIDISDRYTDVSVYKGYVETENMAGKTRINAGDMVSLGQNTYGETASMGPPDEWERWNKSRNDRINSGGGESSRYLPAELRTYAYDFDSSGRWVRLPQYGYVWTPTVFIGTGWSPYRHGRWIWRGGDYVWVSYEPWGWAPYHYGRWSFMVNIGWFWVPPVPGAVYWGPGYVGWVRTDDYVAWVPLAPGEIYYGRGYYGRHSVNITNINITEVNITNVYKNVNINNGVTVVKRNTFNTGSPAIVNVNKNLIREKLFVKDHISVGAPDIKPKRANYSILDKSIPQGKLPPQHVRNIKVKELKQSRRLIKEPRRSVLNPYAEPKELPVKNVATPRTPHKEKSISSEVQPVDKGKPAALQGGPVKRNGHKQVAPTERVAPRAPVFSPKGRGENQQSVQPLEKRKPTINKVAPERIDKRLQVAPSNKPKPGSSVVTPNVRGEKQKGQSNERRMTIKPEIDSAPRGEGNQVKPVERMKSSTSGSGLGERDKKFPDEITETPRKIIKQGTGKPAR